jgi:hypothetical protein
MRLGLCLWRLPLILHGDRQKKIAIPILTGLFPEVYWGDPALLEVMRLYADLEFGTRERFRLKMREWVQSLITLDPAIMAKACGSPEMRLRAITTFFQPMAKEKSGGKSGSGGGGGVGVAGGGGGGVGVAGSSSSSSTNNTTNNTTTTTASSTTTNNNTITTASTTTTTTSAAAVANCSATQSPTNDTMWVAGGLGSAQKLQAKVIAENYQKYTWNWVGDCASVSAPKHITQVGLRRAVINDETGRAELAEGHEETDLDGIGPAHFHRCLKKTAGEGAQELMVATFG